MCMGCTCSCRPGGSQGLSLGLARQHLSVRPAQALQCGALDSHAPAACSKCDVAVETIGIRVWLTCVAACRHVREAEEAGQPVRLAACLIEPLLQARSCMRPLLP